MQMYGTRVYALLHTDRRLEHVRDGVCVIFLQNHNCRTFADYYRKIIELPLRRSIIRKFHVMSREICVGVSKRAAKGDEGTTLENDFAKNRKMKKNKKTIINRTISTFWIIIIII